MIWPDINIHFSNENFLEFELISFFSLIVDLHLHSYLYVDSGIPCKTGKTDITYLNFFYVQNKKILA